ncbi:MAG: hypothetical protein ACR2RD_00355 [Woeseiaceae bacterium]
MRKRTLTNMLVVMLLAMVATPASSQVLHYDFLKTTPIGSWQLREDTNTDHKGRQTVAATRTSLVGEEVRDGDVTATAGSFPARKIQGTGTAEMKVIFKKISVTSNNTAWLSDQVPFGMVRSEGESITNGKTSTHSSELLEYGESGAVTQITKTPEDLPAMPSMKDIFKQ